MAAFWSLALPLPNLFAQEAEIPSEDLRQQLAKALQSHNSAQAVAVLDQLVAREPQNARLFYLRGCENLRIGAYRQSVSDFDRYVELRPSADESLWERGISCYFAGDYQEGAEQFARYQNYHDQDVENSVWRYLCLAESKGLETARQTLLPIERDPRPGLMEVLEMYKGNIRPEQLLKDVEETKLQGEAAAGYRFYSYLYVGLYYIAHDQPDKAGRYLTKAADPQLLKSGESRISRYMWDVANVAQREVTAAQESTKGEEK